LRALTGQALTGRDTALAQRRPRTPPPPGQYLYSLSTTDIAVADANADGLPDLLFTGDI
jgi:hypothetical protein